MLLIRRRSSRPPAGLWRDPREERLRPSARRAQGHSATPHHSPEGSDEAPRLRPAALSCEGEDSPTPFVRPVAFREDFERAQDRAIAQEQAKRTGGDADEINEVLRGGPDPGPTQITPRVLETWTIKFGKRAYSKQLPAGATDAQVRAAFSDEYQQARSEVGRAAVRRPTLPDQPRKAKSANEPQQLRTRASAPSGATHPKYGLRQQIGGSNPWGKFDVDVAPLGSGRCADVAPRSSDWNNGPGTLLKIQTRESGSTEHLHSSTTKIFLPGSMASSHSKT